MMAKSGPLGTKYRELTEADTWENLFSEIQDVTLTEEKQYTLNNAAKNYAMNRYQNILPYDHTIVKLQNDAYVNANHLILKDINRHYILAQAPLSIGIQQFWQMVYEQNVKCIIMLNRIYELSVEKCCPYFPGKEDGLNGHVTPQKICAGNFILDLTKEEHKSFYTIRTINLKNKKENKDCTVLQYQYNKWPDHGIPDTTEHFLEFLSVIRKQNHLNAAKQGPVICHCSAGVGRTGTFVLVDSALVITEMKKASEIDIKKMIIEYRRSRMKLVQTPDQLKFAWKVIIDALDEERWQSLVETTCIDDLEEAVEE